MIPNAYKVLHLLRTIPALLEYIRQWEPPENGGRSGAWEMVTLVDRHKQLLRKAQSLPSSGDTVRAVGNPLALAGGVLRGSFAYRVVFLFMLNVCTC